MKSVKAWRTRHYLSPVWARADVLYAGEGSAGRHLQRHFLSKRLPYRDFSRSRTQQKQLVRGRRRRRIFNDSIEGLFYMNNRIYSYIMIL